MQCIFREKQRHASGSKSRRLFYQAEIEKYLTLPIIERKQDRILWWKANILNFETLKNQVLKYLSCPPSSVESERLFSAAGAVYTEARNRLLPENANMLIFIMKNKKIIKKN